MRLAAVPLLQTPSLPVKRGAALEQHLVAGLEVQALDAGPGSSAGCSGLVPVAESLPFGAT